MTDLLIELFSEEIPARMQPRAAEDLQRLVTGGLIEGGLTYSHAAAFATPRRLTLAVEGLPDRSPDAVEKRKGPRVDAPQKAIEGFLRGAGITRADAEELETPKGAVLMATIRKPGRPADDIVAVALEAAIRGFPWPKSMRWGSGDLRWVRPLHRILCVLTTDEGARTVPLEVDGIASGDVTEGHRTMGAGAFRVRGFEDYVAGLRRGHVILDPAERMQAIWHDAEQVAFARGRELVEDRALLAEVAGLVEWPVVLMGEIDARFLSLPPEVLQTSMREHQKFFSVREPGGRITGFVTVANRETADAGATILAGNRKVLAARLSDAAFFWENDLAVARAGMGAWRDKLGAVTFHAKLGSQADRIARIAALAETIAPSVGADPALARQAAEVAKADLASEMVYEFPELQGIMGRYYAAEAGLPEAVADAAEAHYAPLGPSDAVPDAPVSVAVALADKLDTLTGFWTIGETPTGSRDPYALRRAALGVIRLSVENGHRISLREVFDGVWAGDLLTFLHDRLKVQLRGRGIRHDVIDACLAMPGNDDLTLLVRRAEALEAFLATEDGENLLQGFRRANNILTQAEDRDGVEYSFGADVKYAREAAERTLFDALGAAEPRIAEAMAAEDFGAVMGALAELRAPIDGFFEAVQVNAPEQVVRRNRLNLLSRIRGACLAVADLRRVEG